MSVNSIISQEYVPELEALKEIVTSKLFAWKNAPTLEGRMLVESELIETFERIKKFTNKVKKAFATQSPTEQVVSLEKIEVNEALAFSLAKLNSLVNQYVKYIEEQKVLSLSVISGLRRTRQKLATIKMKRGVGCKWAISEGFHNLEFINHNIKSSQKLHVNTFTGTCSLKIVSKELVEINEVSIARSSNGLPGNTELNEVVTENRLPQHMFDGDDETYFEYERYNSGPLKLGLKIDLKSNQIVNNIRIESVNVGESKPFEIEDILFYQDEFESISIRELISPELGSEYFVINPFVRGGLWDAPFLPVKTSSILIKVVQNNSYQTKVKTLDQRNVSQERYSLCIKKIEINKQSYADDGALTSVSIPIPKGLYTGKPNLIAFPQSNSLYKIDTSISLNSGETWSENLTAENISEGKEFLSSGSPEEVIWKIKVSKDSEKFKTAMSFTDDDVDIELKSLITTVSRNHSPATVSLKKRPYNEDICVLQPSIARRSNLVKEGVTIGFLGNDDRIRLELPFSVLDGNVDPSDIRVFVMGQEWVRVYLPVSVRDGGELGWGTYCFSEDYSSILFASEDDRPGERNIVKILLKEDKPTFTKRANGFYCKLSNLFDPDKHNISVKRLSPEPLRKKVILKQGEDIIYLKGKYISSFSLEVTGEDVREESTIADVLSENVLFEGVKYFVDRPNGILYLSKALASTAVATYKHSDPSVLKEEDFEIWHENAKPIGLIINPESIVAKDVVDTIYWPNQVNWENPGIAVKKFVSPKPILSAETGVVEPRTGYVYDDDGLPIDIIDPLFNSLNSFTLTHNHIVKNTVKVGAEVYGNMSYTPPIEVEYIDGKSEFMDLEPMLEEKFPAIAGRENNTIQFKLAAGRNYYPELSVSFERDGEHPSQIINGTPWGSADELIFAAADDNIPEEKSNWFVSGDGLVTVAVASGTVIPSGITMNYYYRGEATSERDKYSVDHDNGIIYFPEDINTETLEPHRVVYKVAEYSVAYNLVEEVNEYSLNTSSNSVEIRTEDLPSKVNSLVKILWGEGPKTEGLKDYEKYFSPMIYSLGIRFY